MTRMSPISGLSGYVLVPLQESADFTLYRGRKHDDPLPVLAIALFEQPSPQSIKRLERDVEKIRMLLEATRDPVSLDAPVGEDGGATVGDFVEDLSFAAPDEALGDTELSREARDLLKLLSPREEQVLRMRFGIDAPGDLTLEEVGKSFELTRERIRQIETKALRKLRLPSYHRKLKAHIER